MSSVTAAPVAASASKDESDPCVVDLLDVARSAQQVETQRFNGPGSVRVIAPAKVNLFLDIGDMRPDGYHEAVSIMHALLLHDVLHLRLAPSRGTGLSVELTCRARSGLAPLDVAPEDNIVSKAIHRLAQALGRSVDETVMAHVEKRIPAQAGLGGGSSDAAAALVGVAQLWGVSGDDPHIGEVARSLGADVPFFLRGGCACFSGVGDVFSHELAPLDAFVALIKPEGGVSTSAAYRAFDACPQRIASADRRLALEARRAADVPLRNNLARASEQLLSMLAEVRAWASGHDDVQEALMSGSGSAVFAICPSFDAASRVVAQARARGWWAHATMFAPLRASVVSSR
ncbi:4-(cytidine 5'-diphospho)-2-C-methyl-D-erythritol kinase [Gordonibacter sp. An230]|nr:4-(cytidine 5'-diphospho)-2-C-methyl-D-erythritol kinase [Gordonibacter sp. An230]